MDKRSLIGLGLIAAILGLWLWLSGPTKEQMVRNKEIKDSIELVKKNAELAEIAKVKTTQASQDTLKQATGTQLSDSARLALTNDYYKDFAPAITGKSETYVLENEVVKVTVNNRGGVIERVELKKYNRPDKKGPVVLLKKIPPCFH